MEYVTKEAFDIACDKLEDVDNRQDARIDRIQKSLDELRSISSNVERLAVSVETMAKELDRQGKDLEEIKGRDGDKWRTVVSYIVTAFVGAVIAYILSRIGL